MGSGTWGRVYTVLRTTGCSAVGYYGRCPHGCPRHESAGLRNSNGTLWGVTVEGNVERYIRRMCPRGETGKNDLAPRAGRPDRRTRKRKRERKHTHYTDIKLTDQHTKEMSTLT